MNAIVNWFCRFRWEPDNWWWELVRLDELGLPSKFNFLVPDKLTHFLAVFGLTWIAYRLGLNRHWAAIVGWGLMMGPWEFVWDGIYRHGASSRDIVANTLGALLCWWWLETYHIVGQSQL